MDSDFSELYGDFSELYWSINLILHTHKITVNPLFKATTLITVPIRKWLDKNAEVRGVTFITGFGRSDQKRGPLAASKPVQFAIRGLSSLTSGRQ